MESSPIAENYAELLLKLQRLELKQQKISKKFVSNFFKQQNPALLPPLRKLGSFSEGSISKNKKERVIQPAIEIEENFPYEVIYSRREKKMMAMKISKFQQF